MTGSSRISSRTRDGLELTLLSRTSSPERNRPTQRIPHLPFTRNSQPTTRPMPHSPFAKPLPGSETPLPFGMDNTHPSRSPSTTPTGLLPTLSSGLRSQPLETSGVLSNSGFATRSRKRLRPPFPIPQILLPPQRVRPTPAQPLCLVPGMTWACPPHSLTPPAQPHLTLTSRR